MTSPIPSDATHIAGGVAPRILHLIRRPSRERPMPRKKHQRPWRERSPRFEGIALALIVQLPLAQPRPSLAADRNGVALAGLEFGGSVGKLLWVSIDARQNTSISDANRYTRLAKEVKGQIELGRASSSLVQANFNFIATTLGYAAVADPEPLSKSVAAVAAWGAKKTGDAIGGMVVDESRKQALAILARGLQNSGLSASQLRSMKPDDLRRKVADLKIGGQTLGEALKNSPESLDMLQANAVDIATHIGVEALAKATGTAADVETIKTELSDMEKKIHDYQEEVKVHLIGVETRVAGLEQATQAAAEKLDVLQGEVRGQAKAIRTLAEISYSGWTTGQKLQAVQGGLFPDLTEKQKGALIESLKADQARETMAAGLQQAAQDFGNLASIASNLGLPGGTVQGLQGAQKVATGIAQFATGDYLGAVASLTSLAGLGAPDAASERHAAMMKYLEQHFSLVNAKLDRVIDLQVKTLQAVIVLADQQRSFRLEVLSQLDRIEETVLRSETLLKAVLLNEWKECDALINGPLNGHFSIESRDSLVMLLDDRNAHGYAATCYSTMSSALDAWVRPAQWTGQILAANSFPSEALQDDPGLQRTWTVFQWQRNRAYTSARDFVVAALTGAPQAPARYLARLTQPVIDAHQARELDALLAKEDLRTQFDLFQCNQKSVLSLGLRDLICFGLPSGSTGRPKTARWRALLEAPLLGPYTTRIVDTGIVLATIADFARRKAGSFDFVESSVITHFGTDGPTNELRQGLKEHKGRDLLLKLQWLSEAGVLQQGLIYGDFTAQLVESTLYDKTTRSLNTAPKGLAPQALEAMKRNPVLARNVVLLAMRHAIEDELGGAKQADSVQYHQTYYHLALQDFKGPQACGDASSTARRKLDELFPSWRFEYRVPLADQGDQALKLCPQEPSIDPRDNTPAPEAGAGVAVALGDFYVVVPTPSRMSKGAFEQPDSLHLALTYRDHLSQAVIDRSIGDTVRTIAGTGKDANAIAGETAFALLNEGWDWQHRRKSN